MPYDWTQNIFKTVVHIVFVLSQTLALRPYYKNILISIVLKKCTIKILYFMVDNYSMKLIYVLDVGRRRYSKSAPKSDAHPPVPCVPATVPSAVVRSRGRTATASPPRQNSYLSPPRPPPRAAGARLRTGRQLRSSAPVSATSAGRTSLELLRWPRAASAPTALHPPPYSHARTAVENGEEEPRGQRWKTAWRSRGEPVF